jgi:hypothetical protein
MWFKWLLVTLFALNIVINACAEKEPISSRVLLPIASLLLMLGVLHYWPS